MFDLEEITKAAEYLKEEEELLSSTEDLAKILGEWLYDQLEEIDLIYSRDSILQRKIHKAELEAERQLIEDGELVA